MTTPTTWRDHSPQLTPSQIDNLEYADRAPWTDSAERTPYLLGIARLLVCENAAGQATA
jgi:hypothetical protein